MSQNKKLTFLAIKLNLTCKKISSDQKIAKIINQLKKTKALPENKQSKLTTKEFLVMIKSLFQFKIKNIPENKCCQACQLIIPKIMINNPKSQT